jgi:hypothetical protein
MRTRKEADPGMVGIMPRPESAAKQWEYTTVLGDRGLDLNALGLDGWELVSTAAQLGDKVVFYFKRLRCPRS